MSGSNDHWQNQILAGRYLVLARLPRGGMAHVYRAIDQEGGDDVAIKTPLLDGQSDLELRQRFQREVQTLRGVQHENLVPIRDSGEHQGVPFFVMDYLSGGTLGKRLQKKTLLPGANGLGWLPNIARALDALHQHGIVHRDVKPGNILFDGQGRAFLSDLGIVKVLKQRDSAQAPTAPLTGLRALGTAEYLAPEMVPLERGRPPQGPPGRADQYSLAVVVYQVLTGQLPLQGASDLELMLMHLNDKPRPAHEVCPALPAAVSEVLARALSKDANARFDSCTAFAQEVFQNLRVFEPTTAPPQLAPDPAPARQPAPVRRGIAGSLALVLAMILTILTPLGWLRLRDLEHRLAEVQTARQEGQKNPSPLDTGDLARGEPDRTAAGKDAIAKVKLAKTITNSIGMKLVLIPAGKFLMGSPSDEKERSTDEKQHEAEISKAFYLGVTEVTQKQYRGVMGKNPSYFSVDGGGKDKVKGLDTDDFPVESVSWQDATDFCKKLSALSKEKKKGQKYRLPSEAEWEYACRGGPYSKTTPFHFGYSLSSTQANFIGNYPYGRTEKGPYLERTRAVGAYTANAVGLYDMHGNVWEWCSDWYDKDYYAKSSRRDPVGPSEGAGRAVRGGSWSSSGRNCRSAIRYWDTPGNRTSNLGFRAALVPSGD